MSITSQDLKFRQSERMTQFDDGGGRMSSTEVVDGELNNVFPDLSDANTIVGNVALLKIFGQVDTANADTFLGPFLFLTDPPVNSNVSVCLFDTRSATDERADAQNYVESYRLIGVKSQFVLYGDHFIGQRTVQVYCRDEIPSPDIGDVLTLSVEKTGYPANQQFIAVQEVSSRVSRTFTDGQGDFTRDVLMIKTTSALQYDFDGQQDPVRSSLEVNSPTLVRLSQVNDAAKYYGLKKVAEAPSTGDTVIHVGTPYFPIVPTSQAETPVTDELAGLAAISYAKCSATDALTLGWSTSKAAGEASTRYFGSPYGPGTLGITIGSVALRDDGHGGIEAVNPGDTGWSGIADYLNGMVSIVKDASWSGSIAATATAAAPISTQSFSRALPIKAANRSISYVDQIPGQPSPGTVTLDYRALGKWIRLTDNGRGRLAGNPGEGSATINYSTGSLAVTLGALPDVDSALILAWGTDLRARNSSGEITVPTPAFRQPLDNAGVTPGSFSMSWVSGAVTKTATATAAGVISGDATGHIDHTAGLVEFTTAAIPDSGEQFQYSYSYVDPSKRHTEVFTPSASGSEVNITLANPPAENSIVARWNISSNALDGTGRKLRRAWAVSDDGAGGFNGAISGTNTCAYSTGALVLTVE